MKKNIAKRQPQKVNAQEKQIATELGYIFAILHVLLQFQRTDEQKFSEKSTPPIQHSMRNLNRCWR